MSSNYYVNNPSYYRSHQYAHQHNLPDSAMNNRKMPVYTSEMPQGNDAFLPSHKKHFQRVGYRSIISQEQIINHQPQEQTFSPAKNREYYRNLSIQDIEGASTNTLISQALKNRIKAKEHYLRRQKQQKIQQSAVGLRFSEQPNMQQQATTRFKLSMKDQNYHSRRPVKTEGNGQALSGSQQNEPENNKVNQYKRQIEQAQRDIEELERKLDIAKQGVDREKKDNLVSIQQRRYKQESQPPKHNKIVLPKIVNNQQQRINLNQSNDERKQISQLKKRSNTLPNQPQNSPYPLNDKIKQHSDYQSRVEQSRLRRQQIRRLNPTYLSYGTYALNKSAKQVYL